MKKYWILPIVLCIAAVSVSAADWLTIYNEDLALVRSQFDLPLQKGSQYYNFDGITSRIRTESVIVSSTKDPVVIAEQNYEYDLAGTEQILKKYIERDVTLSTKNQSNFSGKMKFFDGQTVGLLEKGTEKLILVNRSEIQQILLAELPTNFYTKPTLRWRLIADKKATFPMQVSYLTGGLSWDVTYNGKWDGKNLVLNSWVTINNQSGKGFENTNLKLIAGEVNQVRQEMMFGGPGGGRASKAMMAMDSMEAAPAFEEKAFHDFHMYALSEPVSFADKQIKQLQLFPVKTVAASQIYEYNLYGDGVYGKIRFENKETNGLGIPLPKGVFKIYKEDTDKNLEFIGEDNINHTAKNEEITITTGKAFDLVGETLNTNSRRINDKTSENDFQITLRNNSKETKVIRIKYPKNPYGDILEKTESMKHELNAKNEYIWNVTLEPDKGYKLTFTERTKY
jgi:hypothetical protein